MFRSWYAIGISTGLSLVLVNSANAQQQEIRHHHARASFHHRDADHHQAAAKNQREKDAKELTSLKKEIHDLRRQVVAVELLRHELTDLKEKIWGPTPLPLTLAVLPRPQSVAVVEPKQVTLKLPDFGEPRRPQVPVNPASASLPAVIEEREGAMLPPKSAVEEAKAYLIDTATPGYTMVRQGVPVAIGRLHPEFIVKLAAAIKLARAEGMSYAGLFSAYRPPAFGIGGFSDKFNSLHSYGLAVDMTGIGGPGSRFAKLWQTIVSKVGLYLPLRAQQPRGIQPYPAGPDQDGIGIPAPDHHGERAEEPAADVAGFRRHLLRGRCHGDQGARSRQRILVAARPGAGGRCRHARHEPAAACSRRSAAALTCPPTGQDGTHPCCRAIERAQDRQVDAQGGKEINAASSLVPNAPGHAAFARRAPVVRCAGKPHCALLHHDYDCGRGGVAAGGH